MWLGVATFAQRAIFGSTSPTVPDKERLTEEEFKLKFQLLHADVLGALCGAIAHGLKVEEIAAEAQDAALNGELLPLDLQGLRDGPVAEGDFRHRLRGQRP